MEFRIADTFIGSLARLAADKQKAAKMAAFGLQPNPGHLSLQFHKLDKAKDPNFCFIRVNRDVRVFVHRTGASPLLSYVNHQGDGLADGGEISQQGRDGEVFALHRGAGKG